LSLKDSDSIKTVFFAGGGTGGHIYPAIAVAEKIVQLGPDINIHFFCSSRDIDSAILKKTSFPFTPLPATGLSPRPDKALKFIYNFYRSCKITRQILISNQNPSVVGIGGFVAAPVCRTAYKMHIPVNLVNVDITPGKANRFASRYAENIFVQFEDTILRFKKTKAKIQVTGCPLRSEFYNADPESIKDELDLAKNKKILLITGASSGSDRINRTIAGLIPELNAFADTWQIVHLTGRSNFQSVKQRYSQANPKIDFRLLDYCDKMANLLKAADLVIGRSGAVSVAEYAAAGAATICMPYPHHRDMHQYHNTRPLVDAGAAIIVDDLADDKDRTQWLWEELKNLMGDENKLDSMIQNAKKINRGDASLAIAKRILNMD
jgi:UDP-N-acetylglucosamine--N-acetylmuramyl-(pentapeptide) pyrophosphoryl-undecaprenol N-acetylglucosamine transferase